MKKLILIMCLCGGLAVAGCKGKPGSGIPTDSGLATGSSMDTAKKDSTPNKANVVDSTGKGNSPGGKSGITGSGTATDTTGGGGR
jgi:hypothetical protein